jgi:hypothetical protein
VHGISSNSEDVYLHHLTFEENRIGRLVTPFTDFDIDFSAGGQCKADGGSSVECGFELAFTVLDVVNHRPLINCQRGLWIPYFFAAALGS